MTFNHLAEWIVQGFGMGFGAGFGFALASGVIGLFQRGKPTP